MRIREWIHRLLGTVRPRRQDEELQEELSLHLELAAEEARRRGQTLTEANRAARIEAGGVSQAMEAMRDQRGVPWLQSLGLDLVFGWRQLNKHRSASLAAILSLGLAIGATTAAFRLVDAVLLRTLPVADPDRLFSLAFNSVTSRGDTQYRDEFDYPTFRRYRAVVGDRADLMLVGMSSLQQIAFNGAEIESASRQYFSGNVFPTFGLQPALGRLLGPGDDLIPGGHPVAVISYEYWTRRFARDPGVVGRTFQWGRSRFEIVGVAPKGFTGTEPGRATDFFSPSMMNSDALEKPGWSWFRLWVRPKDGINPEQVRQMLQAVFVEDHKAHAKTLPPDTPPQRIAAYIGEQLFLSPAGSGASAVQRNLGRPLLILAGLGMLVLLIACANVANLLGAQSVTRGREMALRVSIGAGRWRLVRLVLMESAVLAVLSSTVGALFAWWAAPFVVSLIELDQPLRLALDVDWRALAFVSSLTVAVAVVFGLVPAWRASSVDPIRTLKGSDGDPHAHRRLARSLIGVQTAFSVFVLFITGLFVATFDNLSDQPLGFSQERLLALETQPRGNTLYQANWLQVAEQIRSVPGVESAAVAAWAPLTGNGWSQDVRVENRAPENRPPYFLDVSPAYFGTMRIPMIGGRDFRPGDEQPIVNERLEARPGVGIVNQAFARVYFDGHNPVGKRVTVRHWQNVDIPMEIIGLVGDAVYRSVRDVPPPTVYVPIDKKTNAALMVRTAGDPLLLASTLRREVSRLRSDVRVGNVATQSELGRRQVMLERLLAMLSSFFAVVALLLSGIGLYGVLNYAVIRQRREIGVRMALGASAAHVVRRVTAAILTPVGVGLAIGLIGGFAFGRLIERLLFQTKATDPGSFAMPLLMLAVAATVAALPPAMRAVRIDPAQALRSE
jgi:putative ABC transport system permease protein